MKYRIVMTIDDQNKALYTVERKFFLFWHSMKEFKRKGTQGWYESAKFVSHVDAEEYVRQHVLSVARDKKKLFARKYIFKTFTAEGKEKLIVKRKNSILKP